MPYENICSKPFSVGYGIGENYRSEYCGDMTTISRLRKAKNWTQQDLAEIAGMEQSTVSKAERMAPGVSIRSYTLIADALEVPLAQLFFDELSDAELVLLQAFRRLPRDRQLGWIDMAKAADHPPE